MLEKILIIIIGFILGAIISRIINFVEIHELKEQVFELEKDNEVIVKDNADLVRQNDVLRRQLFEVSKKHPDADIDFGDW